MQDMEPTVRQLAARFLREDSGQDLIEYGLLTGIVVAIGIVVFTTIQGKMGAAYQAWEGSAQSNWVPNPAGS
jgi:Flp pilus assembly pilin Flp